MRRHIAHCYGWKSLHTPNSADILSCGGGKVSETDLPSLTLCSRCNHWSSRVSLISTRKETCSRLSQRIKGFYCAAKRNKNSLKGEKIPHPTEEREEKREKPIEVTGWTDKFKAKKEIKLVLREGCRKGYKLKKRDRATGGKYKSRDKSEMRFSDMARQKVPKTPSRHMCCKKNARTQSALFQTRVMQEPGMGIIPAPDPFPHH